ncbi:MAG: DUF4186 family protein [Chryseobacterium sp.]|nr:MAG: DUF4186 family protein [Chryseobacterium sp.]
MGKFKRVPVDEPVSGLTPLKISCGSTKCDEGLHCFTRFQKDAQKKFGKTGVCYECGVAVDSLARLHEKKIEDIEFTFEELQNELIRKVFWSMPIKDSDKQKALKKGIDAIKNDTIKRLTKYIGIPNPFRDGITPYEGNIIHYGQHATGSCCRTCIEFWHGIPKGRSLTANEVSYLSNLISAYAVKRIPELV